VERVFPALVLYNDDTPSHCCAVSFPTFYVVSRTSSKRDALACFERLHPRPSLTQRLRRASVIQRPSRQMSPWRMVQPSGRVSRESRAYGRDDLPLECDLHPERDNAPSWNGRGDCLRGSNLLSRRSPIRVRQTPQYHAHIHHQSELFSVPAPTRSQGSPTTCGFLRRVRLGQRN
jgi:hypothetical protein